MKHAALSSFASGAALRRSAAMLLVPVLSLLALAARADDYGDVNRLLRQGSPAEALAKADAYIAGKPRDPQMRFLRGVILTEQGRKADAMLAFTQLTQDFPELPEPYNNLAALYAQQSQFDRARDALETAIRLSPGYATAYENLGDVYARLAAQTYDRAQKLAPANGTIAPKLASLRQVFATPASDALPPATPVPRRIPNNNR
jgi:Flp pilus assembly protein TadD